MRKWEFIMKFWSVSIVVHLYCLLYIFDVQLRLLPQHKVYIIQDMLFYNFYKKTHLDIKYIQKTI